MYSKFFTVALLFLSTLAAAAPVPIDGNVAPARRDDDGTFTVDDLPGVGRRDDGDDPDLPPPGKVEEPDGVVEDLPGVGK